MRFTSYRHLLWTMALLAVSGIAASGQAPPDAAQAQSSVLVTSPRPQQQQTDNIVTVHYELQNPTSARPAPPIPGTTGWHRSRYHREHRAVLHQADSRSARNNGASCRCKRNRYRQFRDRKSRFSSFLQRKTAIQTRRYPAPIATASIVPDSADLLPRGRACWASELPTGRDCLRLP